MSCTVGQVVLYLREQLGVTRLAVHGESIGGVAAASVARHCQVSMREKWFYLGSVVFGAVWPNNRCARLRGAIMMFVAFV